MANQYQDVICIIRVRSTFLFSTTTFYYLMSFSCFLFFFKIKKIFSKTYLHNNLKNFLGGYKMSLKISNFQHRFVFALILYVIIKMDETFFVLSFMDVTFLICETFYQHKFLYKLFLPAEFNYKNISSVVFQPRS